MLFLPPNQQCQSIEGIFSIFTEELHKRLSHTRLTALCPGLPGWAGTRKVKPIWILMEQETVSGSGISLAICKSAPRSRQITTRAPHHSVFLQAGCPACRPTNSVKALKALNLIILWIIKNIIINRYYELEYAHVFYIGQVSNFCSLLKFAI